MARARSGLWSRLPLSDTKPVKIDGPPGRAQRADERGGGPPGGSGRADIEMASNRALRTTVATGHGPLAVYVAHLGSVRVNPRAGFWTDSRDRSAQALGEAIAAERNHRVEYTT
jgi:vancomycin resistance protein VanJ